MKYIAITKEYRDKVNGNSYFSTRIEDVENDRMYILPFQYGYGTQSEHETKKLLNVLTKMSHGMISNLSRLIDVLKEKLNNTDKE